MKKYSILILVLTVIIFQSFCENTARDKSSKISLHHSNPPNTTLDSLQGSWISIDDSLNRVSVLNRTYVEFYADKDSARENFRIYFSDTLVDINLSFSNIHIDTTALSGHYIITKSVLDDTFWCYEFIGFNNDGINRYFSISDTWAKHKPTVFAKQ